MNGGDLQDWASGTNDSFNAFSSAKSIQNDLDRDLRVIDVIGMATTGDRINTNPNANTGRSSLNNQIRVQLRRT